MQVASYLKLSIAVALVTIALKTGAWWWTGSVSLAADALESLVNLAGAIFALAMVTVAAKPPDAEHPFGHHKAEYFSSGFEGRAQSSPPDWASSGPPPTACWTRSRLKAWAWAWPWPSSARP